MDSKHGCRPAAIGFEWGGAYHARHYGYQFPDWTRDYAEYRRALNEDLADMPTWELKAEARRLYDVMAAERRDRRLTSPLMPMPSPSGGCMPVRFDDWGLSRCAEIGRILNERGAHGGR